MNDSLLCIYNSIEVTKALNQMHPFKTHGPDSMSPIFYQKYWYIVGSDVTREVLKFLNKDISPTNINHTYVVLNPKCQNPYNNTQFHPVSLCNIVYKLASKVLANRIRSILSKVISPCQSAFMLGCLITYNILISC